MSFGRFVVGLKTDAEIRMQLKWNADYGLPTADMYVG